MTFGCSAANREERLRELRGESWEGSADAQRIVPISGRLIAEWRASMRDPFGDESRAVVTELFSRRGGERERNRAKLLGLWVA